jgi:hypothetical protein
MFRQVLSLILTASLFAATIPQPGLAQTPDSDVSRVEEFKKRVVEEGTNRQVTVKFKAGGKLKGRVAEIKDEFFSVQFVDKGQVTTREVRYDEIKSLSVKGKGNAGKTIAYAAIGAAAGLFIVMGIMYAVYDD